MQRSDVIAFLDFCLDRIVDEDTGIEFLAAVNDAVTHGVNLVIALDAAFDRVSQDIEDSLNSALVVGKAELDDGL